MLRAFIGPGEANSDLSHTLNLACYHFSKEIEQPKHHIIPLQIVCMGCQ